MKTHHPYLTPFSRLAIIPCLLVLLLLSGCTRSFYLGNKPQSHFDYPNSNVTPLQQTSGEATVTTVLVPPQVTGELERRAIQDALNNASGADMLINYSVHSSLTIYPIPYLTLYILKMKVQGTAAKADIGKQALD